MGALDQSPNALFHKDGVDGDALLLRDVAPELGLALRMSAMGLAEGDRNDDGVPDYLISHLGAPYVFVSDPSGVHVDAGTGLGLTYDIQPRIIG